VFVGDFPLLVGRILPFLETAKLLRGINLQPKLHDHGAKIDKLPLEVVDLVVSPFPVALAAKALDALHQHAAVPGAVEDRDMPRLGNAPPKTPEIMMGLF